jgi:hypothetical protein
MTQHHDNPFISVMLSIGAGLVTWLADPVLWKALSVALLTGIIGGLGHLIGRSIGFFAWRSARKARRAQKAQQRKDA